MTMVERATKPAPAKKRPSCRRARCEKKEEKRGSSLVAVAGDRSIGAIMPRCRKAIELGGMQNVSMRP